VKQLTLVAFYGAKDPRFARRIIATQQAIRSALPLGTFVGYSVEQVHATLAGMERLDDRTPPVGRNAWHARKAEVVMDFSRLREVVARHLPLTIRCGGFDPSWREFTSRGESPYVRTFQLQLATRRATLMGWAHVAGDFGDRLLAGLRDDLEQTCGIAHKYPDDNDLFLTLGALAGDATGIVHAAARAERAVRDDLAVDPLELELTEARVHVARYESESLEPGSTETYSIGDSLLGSAFLNALYEP